MNEIKAKVRPGDIPHAKTYEGPYLVTPTEEAQTLATANQLMAADTIVAAIPDRAEKIYSYHNLVNVAEADIPSYSTVQQTVVAATSLPNITTDYENYDYFLVERSLSFPLYAAQLVNPAGSFEWAMLAQVSEFGQIADGTIPAITNPTKSAGNGLTRTSANNITRTCYWSANDAVSLDATSYGVYQSTSAPVFSDGNVVTLKTPVLRVRGNATYCNSTCWGYWGGLRYQYVIELWRVPKSNSQFKPFRVLEQSRHVINCIKNGGILT